MFGQSNKRHYADIEGRPSIEYERLYRRSSNELDSPHTIGDDVPVDSNDDDTHSVYAQCPEKTVGSQPFKVPSIKHIAIILLACFGFVDMGYRAYDFAQSHKHTSCNCGDTITEALTNNCRYDSFAAAWLPPACRNDELIDKFERAGPNSDGSWDYYADKNKTQLLSLDQVSRLPETGSHFFTTHHWHLVHCMYYWKKMFLSTKTGTVVENRYNNLAHLEHCEMMFLKRDPLDIIVTEAGVSLHSDVLVVSKSHDHDHNHDHPAHSHPEETAAY